jgi:hypothetical protein
VSDIAGQSRYRRLRVFAPVTVTSFGGPIVNSLVVLFLQVAGGGAALALFLYALYRAVLAAKKAGRKGSGGQAVGIFLTFLGPVIAPSPPRELTTESRELKRDQDESGDPP